MVRARAWEDFAGAKVVFKLSGNAVPSMRGGGCCQQCQGGAVAGQQGFGEAVLRLWVRNYTCGWFIICAEFSSRIFMMEYFCFS